MEPLRIKDNEQVKKEEFAKLPYLVHRIADKTLERLEQEGVFVFPEIFSDTQDLDKDQMILQSVNDSYRACNVMGFIGCGDERLIIGSRFCRDGEDHFLQYLLGKVLGWPNIVDLETDANGDNQLFNFLVFLFPHYLKQAMRKGLFKKYIRNLYNDANVKGTIDIARHIKQNTPFVGDIAYGCREFSYDNSLTELVRHTIEFIKGKPYGNKILQNVKDEVKLVVNATPGYAIRNRQKIINENQKHAVRHAYFKEYLALQRLCLLILRHQKHQIGLGPRQIYGILFDGAWLWEEYVASLIGSKEHDYFYHPKNKCREGKQFLFSKQKNAKREHENVGEIYPDFIGKNAVNRSVADAKYKPNENIGSHDYLQVLAYMYRFDAKVGYYLYPEADGDNDQVLYLNRGSTFENNVAPRDDVVITKHGLKIPINATSYCDFATQMGESEQQFLQPFLGGAISEGTI